MVVRVAPLTEEQVCAGSVLPTGTLQPLLLLRCTQTQLSMIYNNTSYSLVACKDSSADIWLRDIFVAAGHVDFHVFLVRRAQVKTRSVMLFLLLHLRHI